MLEQRSYQYIVDFIREQFGTNEFIPLHEPRFCGNERKYVLECIDSTYVSSVGKYVNDFEKHLAEYTGSEFAVACANGTSALHMSLLVAGVQRNDLVITQPLSFIATCNAISYLGASPIFVDVDKDTLGLSPEKLKAFLTENTIQSNGNCILKSTNQKISACVPMHTFGHPCRIDEIAEICDQFKIPVVEDAAESIGSYYKNKHTGTYGLFGAFSFNGNKTITCGGGGAIITNNKELALKAKHLTTQAKVPHRWEFIHDAVGYNYRMPNINAALLCAQFEQLEKFLEDKRRLAESYKTFFEGTGIKFVNEPSGSRSNYWLCSILLSDRSQRDKFLEFTNDNGIMTRPSWTLMTELPMFKNCISGDISTAKDIVDRLVNIPSSTRSK